MFGRTFPPFVEKVSLLSTLKEGLVLRERFFGIPAVFDFQCTLLIFKALFVPKVSLMWPLKSWNVALVCP